MKSFIPFAMKRILNRKLPLMPLFSCGAIPQAISRESPTKKMHAHLRSFSFYQKIVTNLSIQILCQMCEIHKLHRYQIVNYLSVQAEIIKLTNIVNFFAINCHFTGTLNLE